MGADSGAVEKKDIQHRMGEGKFGGKPHPVVIQETVLQGDEGKDRERGERKVYFDPQQRRSRDPYEGYGRIERAIAEFDKKAARGEAITDNEVNQVLSEIDNNCPGGDRTNRWELGQYVSRMIIDVSGKDPKKTETAWTTLVDPKTDNKKKKELLQASPAMVTVIGYLAAHGLSQDRLAGIKWNEVLGLGQAIEAINNNGPVPDEVLQMLTDRAPEKSGTEKKAIFAKVKAKENKKIGAEGGWESKERKLQAYENMLGMQQKELQLDTNKFWRRQFYERAVMPSLKAMGPAEHGELIVEKTPGRARRKLEKLQINIDRNSKKANIAPSLGYAVVNEHTAIGKFLDSLGEILVDGKKINVARYWRGIAALYEAYYYGYKQQFLSMKDSQSRTALGSWFVELKGVEDIGMYMGYTAMAMMGEDDKLAEAVYVLYSSGGNSTYTEKLQRLGKKYGFYNEKTKKFNKFPEYITRAIMVQEIFALDPENIHPDDKRETVYNIGKWDKLEVVTDAAGNPMEFLGVDFAFTTLAITRLGIASDPARKYDYRSLAVDDNFYNPETDRIQHDLEWQYCHFFRLALSHPELRRIYDRPRNQLIIKQGDEITPVEAVPGQSGQFMAYENNLFDTESGEYVHRKAVFENFKKQLEHHEQLKRDRGYGMAGWDEVDLTRQQDENTMAKRVAKVVSFFENPLTTTMKFGNNELKIEKGAGEIWWDYELGVILDAFANDPKNKTFAKETGINYSGKTGSITYQEILVQFQLMNECLNDFRAWGQAFDLTNPDVISTMRNRMSLARTAKYDGAGIQAVDMLRKVLAATPADILQLPTTPAKILELMIEMRQDFTQSQHYPRFIKLLETIDKIVVRKYIELQIASVQEITKAIMPGGEVELGAFKDIRKMIGGRKKENRYSGKIEEYRIAHETLKGEIEQMGQMDKLREGLYIMIATGLFENYENLALSTFAREFLAESADWARSRQWPIEHRLLLAEMASYYNPLIPIESSRILPATIHGDDIYLDETLYQGWTRTGIRNCLKTLDIHKPDENRLIGNIHGGKLPATFTPSEGEEIKGYIYQQKVVKNDLGRDELWVRFGPERSDWIKFNNNRFTIKINESVEKADADVLDGEHLHAGVRLRYNIENKKWYEVRGNWELKQDRTGYHFKADQNQKGPIKKLKLGTDKLQKPNLSQSTTTGALKKGKTVIVLESGKYTEMDGERAFGVITAADLQEVNELGIVQEAVMPWAIWKSNGDYSAEEVREMYKKAKHQIVLGFEMGAGSPTRHGGGGKAQNIPILLHQAREIGMTEFSVNAYKFQQFVRANIRMGVVRKLALVGLSGLFHKETTREEMIKGFSALFEKMASGELWGSDIKIVKTLMKDMTVFDWALMAKNDEMKNMYDEIFKARSELRFIDTRIKSKDWPPDTEEISGEKILRAERVERAKKLVENEAKRKEKIRLEKLALFSGESKNKFIRGVSSVIMHKFELPILKIPLHTVPTITMGGIAYWVLKPVLAAGKMSLISGLGIGLTVAGYLGAEYGLKQLDAWLAEKIDIDMAKLDIWGFVDRFLSFDAMVTPE